jgi:trk system potassium uptake protein TrkH
MRYDNRERLESYIDLFFIFIEFDIFVLILFELGFPFRPIEYTLGYSLGGLVLFELLIHLLLVPRLRSYFKSTWRQYLITALLLYASFLFRRVGETHRFIQIYSRFYLISLLILLFIKFVIQTERLGEIFRSFRVNPAQAIIVSFASIIALGSFLLYLPYSRPGGTELRYVDALFSSTSAVCVTGLIVVDTGTAFSIIGQAFILMLIQMGGLGIMTIAAFIQVSLGSNMTISGRFSTANLLGQGELKNLYSIIRAIVFLTFAFEAAGAAALFPYFSGEFGSGVKALYYSVFHAVSAFCNAGFSLYTKSFTAARGNIGVNLVVMSLIVSGGVGFTVLHNIIRRTLHFRTVRLTVQTRIVLITTLFFILFGALNFYFLERNGVLSTVKPHEMFLASLFQSVTTRTAGFNTVDTAQLRPVTLFMMSILMFIGASPGSTGGGIKTTTFFVLMLSIVTLLRDQRFNMIFQRRIPFAVVNRAFAIMVASVLVIIMGILLLGYSQNFTFMQIYFETVSAFGTVGLSTGITPHLSDFGKIVIMLIMFVGRIGPLTMVLAIRNLQGTRLVLYPEERIMVG